MRFAEQFVAQEAFAICRTCWGCTGRELRGRAYPLSRRLYLYLPDNAKPEARDFARFALSAPGQDIVQKDGFVGQKVDVMRVEAPETDAVWGTAIGRLSVSDGKQ